MDSADRLFEKLGFTKTRAYSVIYYSKVTKYKEIQIQFNIYSKEVHIVRKLNGKVRNIILNERLLRAVYLKCKELGFNLEDNNDY